MFNQSSGFVMVLVDLRRGTGDASGFTSGDAGDVSGDVPATVSGCPASLLSCSVLVVPVD